MMPYSRPIIQAVRAKALRVCTECKTYMEGRKDPLGYAARYSPRPIGKQAAFLETSTDIAALEGKASLGGHGRRSEVVIQKPRFSGRETNPESLHHNVA